ncbi:hypothetical protein JL09_g7060 [Pichia kudriavzevii]|uniref:Uncharacterized protein n=1 Tax=Pichia kudriavzevii TaxID=4909 RepID=A0A099NI00_PICKU|nr:hypothetical protein JL09_g7060 [Pichia kudriavzevii]
MYSNSSTNLRKHEEDLK